MLTRSFKKKALARLRTAGVTWHLTAYRVINREEWVHLVRRRFLPEDRENETLYFERFIREQYMPRGRFPHVRDGEYWIVEGHTRRGVEYVVKWWQLI